LSDLDAMIFNQNLQQEEEKRKDRKKKRNDEDSADSTYCKRQIGTSRISKNW
jgi:hypothetical protein